MRPCAWACIAISLLPLAVFAEPDVLVTVPQADPWRSAKTPASASVSADGRYVVFSSYARLAPADVDDDADIYVLDRLTGRVTLESLAADGKALDGESMYPRLSGDGGVVVFETHVASGGPHPPDTDIVVRDRRRDAATRVGRDVPPGAQLLSRQPAISDDGRLVVFASAGTVLVPGPDENGSREDVYAFEVPTRALRRVSVDSRGAQRQQGASYAPSVSGNGRFVAFTSTADLDAVPVPRKSPSPKGPPRSQVYARDMERGTTTRVSAAPGRGALDGASYDPAISRDGRFVAFVSAATTLAPGDRNRSPDVFVVDMHDGSTTLVSRRAGGGSANGPSGSPAISADGRAIAFESEASDLVCAKRCGAPLEDLNLLPDVFLFDRIGGGIARISAAPSGGWGEESGGPWLDAAGTIVTFTSRHPIDERDLRNDFDLFVRIPGQIVADERRDPPSRRATGR